MKGSGASHLRLTIRLVAVAMMLLITAHRLPAPISEEPESPTPTPQPSAPSRDAKATPTKPSGSNSSQGFSAGQPKSTAPPQPEPKHRARTYSATGQLIRLEHNRVVFKKGSDLWEAARDSRTTITGKPKVGELATIIYRMVATDGDSNVAVFHLSGSILDVSDSMVALRKGDNRWEIVYDRGNVKGRAGENATIDYTMIATDIAAVSAEALRKMSNPHERASPDFNNPSCLIHFRRRLLATKEVVLPFEAF